MTTETAINLTPEELELVRIAREEKALAAQYDALEAEKKAAQAAKEEAAATDRLRNEHLAIVSKAMELIGLDTEGLLTVEWNVNAKSGVNMPSISFKLSSKAKYSQQISVGEHRVYSGNYSMRSHSNGLKFEMPRDIDKTYQTKWVKNPKTVLKNVKEMVEMSTAREARKAKTETLNVNIENQLNEMYPDADVQFNDKQWRSSPSSYYDTWTVKVAKGSVVFVADVDVDGNPTPKAYSVHPGSELKQDIANMILS